MLEKGVASGKPLIQEKQLLNPLPVRMGMAEKFPGGDLVQLAGHRDPLLAEVVSGRKRRFHLEIKDKTSLGRE